MRIAHIADVHLDRPFVGLAGEQGDLARQRLRSTFTRCLERANEREVDLITIGGDLWEEENVRVDTRRFAARELGRAGIPVVLICGNHDPYLAGGSYERTEWPENVNVVSTADPTEIAFEGLSVWALSWTGAGLDASFLETFRAPADRRHLLLIHGTAVRVDYFDEQSAHCPFRPEAVRAAGFELCLSGHIHRASPTDGVIYPGSPEPLGWAETGDHCLAIVELGDRVEVELLPINEHRYEHVHVDCTGCDSSAEITERLRAALPSEDAERLHVRAQLGGEIDRECEVSANLLAAEFVDDYAQIDVVDSTTPSYDLDHLAQHETVSGLFVRELQEQIAAAVDEREREKLELALVAGLRALDGRADVVHVD